MSDSNNLTGEREEIEQLLPWYVTRTLAASDRRRVERYLAAHPDLERQLALIREDREETLAVNEALGAPRPGALEKLIDAARGGRREPRPRWAGFRAVVDGLFVSPSVVMVRWAAAAALAIVLLQSVIIGTLLLGPTDGYRTASGGPPAADREGTFVLVRFAEKGTAGDVNALLTSLGAHVVDGPKPGGLYKLRISLKRLPAPERGALIARLKGNVQLVTFVSETD